MRPLSDKQRELALWWTDSDDDGIIATGAVRSGKTYSMIIGFLLWSNRCFDHCDFIIGGRTIGSLTRNVVLPMIKILSQDLKWPFTYNRGVGYITVGTNTYHLFGASSEQSQDVLQGMTAAGALLDEVALMPRSFVDQSIARCSIDGSKFWWNCNPSYPTHYIKKEFIDQASKKRIKVMTFTMDDNPTLSKRKREQYERMFAGVFYDRFVRGLWVVAEGLVYQDFDEGTMTAYKPVSDTFRSPHYITIDYGITNPFVALDWVIEDGIAYCVDEYCFDSKAEGHRRTDDEHYRALKEWVGRRYVELVVIDPSANSFKETIERYGDWEYVNAENAVIEGISNVMTAMNQGCLLISPKCERLVSELGLYRWNERKMKEEVIKENDHACDAMRYFVSTVGLDELRCFAW